MLRSIKHVSKFTVASTMCASSRMSLRPTPPHHPTKFKDVITPHPTPPPHVLCSSPFRSTANRRGKNAKTLPRFSGRRQKHVNRCFVGVRYIFRLVVPPWLVLSAFPGIQETVYVMPSFLERVPATAGCRYVCVIKCCCESEERCRRRSWKTERCKGVVIKDDWEI